MNTLILVFAGALGIAFGSFGNVLLYRIHAKKHITGRSMCPSCKSTLAWFELFPVLSFLVLRGKCRRCHHPISVQYPLVELAACIIFVFSFLLHSEEFFPAILTAFILYFLFLACVFDAKYQQIPDVFTICIGVLACVFVIITGNIFSAFSGLAVMLLWFGGQWFFTHGKAVGTGDIFLAAVLGFWLGLRYALITLVFSYMAGAVILLVLILVGNITVQQKRIAFVPFLTIGVFLTLFGAGDVYMKLIGF